MRFAGYRGGFEYEAKRIKKGWKEESSFLQKTEGSAKLRTIVKSPALGGEADSSYRSPSGRQSAISLLDAVSLRQ